MVGIAKSISAGVLLTLLGCGPQYAWEGSYKGVRKLPLNPGVSESVRNTAAAVRLRVLPNGTFEIFEMGLPKSGRTISGGGRLSLQVDTVLDRPIEQPMSFTLIPLSPSRVRLEGGQGEPVVLNRESQPDG